jgi:hypothetical protein
MTCSKCGRYKKNAYKVFIRESERKRPFWIILSCENNNKFEGANKIHIALEEDQWRVQEGLQPLRLAAYLVTSPQQKTRQI